MGLVLAADGIFTPIIASLAAAIGAGIVIGTFYGATKGVMDGLLRKEVEGDALRNGYYGAALSVGFWLFDQCIAYAT